MSDAYERAFARLELFANESPNWDGHGASPAPENVVAGVKALLASAIEHELPAPSLVLTHSGCISVVWNKPGTYYITFLVSGSESFDHVILKDGEKPISGRSTDMSISDSLAGDVRKLCQPEQPLETCSMHVYKDTFTKAYADLKLLSLRGRSGSDGRLSVPYKTIEGARDLLDDAALKGFLEPELSLTDYESIRVEWEDEADWKISVLITGTDGYSYTIHRKACTIASRARPSVVTCGKSKSMVVDPKLEGCLSSMKNLTRKPEKPQPLSIPEHVKQAEISNIRQRLTSVSKATNESSKSYWKGALLGEINMLMRLDALNRHEWMLLQNEVAKAAGDHPYHSFQKLQAEQKLETKND